MPQNNDIQNDASLFAAGALFTQDYLLDGITASKQFADVDAVKQRATIKAIFDGFPHASNPNEATTESDLIWPILSALGWEDYLTQQNLSSKGRTDVPDGLLFIDETAKSKANEFAEEYKRYQFGASIIESKRWARALDRVDNGKDDGKDTPSTQLLRYLRRIDDLTNGDLRWGILTNGNKWRLYFSGARSTIDDYLELDLARIMGLTDDIFDSAIGGDDRDHWLAVFVAMFSRTAFERDTASLSFHDRARSEAALYEKRVADSLSDLVFKQLYPELGKAIAAAAPADTPLDDVRQATLIMLYRLLFVLYAEDRGLLPVKDSRFDDYALRMKRLDVGRRKDDDDVFSDTAPNLWNHFQTLTTIIDKGDKALGVPPYNGGLFSETQTPLLSQIRLGDAVMANALDILSFERRGGQRLYINYRDLSVQQLGSIYERLLEFELTRDNSGIVDIRPNIFARKNSGSYYTPDDLVLLILDETLQPLLDDAMNAFQTALASRDKKRTPERQIERLQQSDPASAITRLRICDPAMGSGHFLVSLVDVLTNHALEAIQEAALLAKDDGLEDYESPVAIEIRKIRSIIHNNADDNGWSVTDEQLDDPQLVKRMILKRCIYGADKNPMAVELAKVSLWLHTFTVGAPLSFIDHHLAAGDSLFGLWVRDAMDKAGENGALFLHEPLQEAQRQARAMKTIESISDADIGEAHKSSELWDDIESATGPFDSFTSFMHALDWLATGKKKDDLKRHKALTLLWLDGRFGEPIPIARGKKAPDSGKAKPEELEDFTIIWAAARSLIDEERFLNWQITFPGVWENWASAVREGGFDAVVGNPPWDIMEFEEVPWFEERSRKIALETNRAARRLEIATLKNKGDPLWLEYKIATDRIALASNIAKNSKIYSKLNKGRINLYKLFIERAHDLVKPNGMVGLLTPSGIAADLSTSKFFRDIATGGHLKSLYDFENKKVFFPDVHASFKFCVMVASPERTFTQSHCAFYLHNLNELKNDEQAFAITAKDFARVNPNTGTAPIFRTRRDMQLTTAIYERLPVLILKSGDIPIHQFNIQFDQMLNMAIDSDKFVDIESLESEHSAWPVSSNSFESKEGVWLPVYEGKMVQAFDHRASHIIVTANNVFRPGQGENLSIEDHQNSKQFAIPRYWIRDSDIPIKANLKWMMSFKDITAATNMRTSISAMIPRSGAGHTLPVAIPMDDALSDYQLQAPLLLANFNTIVFDYLARQKVHGTHLAWYLLEQLPVVPPADYARKFGDFTAADIVKAAVLELTYTAHDMAAFAKDMGHVDAKGEILPPYIWDDERRLHLRAKLDALYFILYGVYDPANKAQSRDDIGYIYSTFPIVERKEIAQYGRYRSRDLCLSYINAIMAGQPNAQIEG